MTPVIGIISCGFSGTRQFVSSSYIQSVCRAGGCPVILPILKDHSHFHQISSLCHGFLFCGGNDINPVVLNRPPLSSAGEADIRTDLFQLEFLRHILPQGKPVLGICRGLQVLNTACGGELLQDISLWREPFLEHMQNSRLRSDPWHTVIFEKDSLLCKICGNSLPVNSFHHQAILTPGRGIRITARAQDGIPEAAEVSAHPFALGVQWHPECMPRSSQMRHLFREFIKHAG